MKLIKYPLTSINVGCLALVLAFTSLSAFVAKAHPFASNITGTNGSGFVSFTLNESGAFVTVTYEDGSTNTVPGAPLDGSSTLAKGTYSFFLEAGHTGFKITCYKQGNGVPSLISSDGDTYSGWNSPRGVAVNKNAAIGTNFGRLVVGNSANGTANGPKQIGLYLLNADQTYVKGPIASNFYSGSGGSGPWRVRANDDGTFLVSDFSTANACLLQYRPDLSASNLVLSIIGQTPASAAGIHGDLFGCGILKGSAAAGNLVLYTFDSGMPTPQDTNCIKGPLTSPGSFNCVFQYNIGGAIPVNGWNKRPDAAYTYGLDGIAELRTEGDIGKDGKIICGYGRANASNPNLQIIRPFITTNGPPLFTSNVDAIENAAKDPTNWLYTGGASYDYYGNGHPIPFNVPPNAGTAGDPWVGPNSGNGTTGGTYAGVRVSPDGVYIASVDINNGATIATLTNGIPNEGTIFGIPNLSTTANSRGMDWDPADNLWICSSGQGLLRCYSLGLTTTCISSNDFTGTNGTFQLTVPPVAASITVTTNTASQNYVNNVINPGSPVSAEGSFRISLNVTDTSATGPVNVGFSRAGPLTSATFHAIYNAAPGNAAGNYDMLGNLANVAGGGYYTNADGVAINTNNVIFPAGVWPHAGTWSVDLPIIAATNPVTGPTVVVNIRLLSGANYSAAAPNSGTIAVLNTGPQYLLLSAAAPSTLGGMNRGIPRDQARFVITRWGDTNGPGNDALNAIMHTSYTVTNVNYFGTAQYPLDYTARAQNFTGSLPTDGTPGITVAPGAVVLNGMIGNPVKHTDTSIRSTNLTVIINLTNHYTCPNGFSNTCNSGTCCTNVASLATNSLLSSEGYNYRVSTTSLTLNEFDNAIGGEVVLWSNPLTNAADSTNWTLVYADINMGCSPTMPTVISNYDNTAIGNGLQYQAWFGKSVHDPGNDYGSLGGIDVPQSDTMLANNWSNALKVSVNKFANTAGESGMNLYPQIPGMPALPGPVTNFMVFNGNYALRFDMYLSLYDFGLNNPIIGTPAREFPAFGINHQGTNANWRLDINPRIDGTGSRPINADGEWCTIGAASGSITPADYDMFISPPWIIPIYDQNGINTNMQVIPYTTNFFIGSNTAVVSSGQLVQVPYTNANQCPPGFYTGVTNVFANGGVPNDQISQNNNSFGGAPENGIIKSPPFSGINNAGGAPDNAWVSVSLEVARQTNLSLLVARQLIFNSSTITPGAGVQNPIAPFGGTPMLGYLDPNADLSDYSAFAYFSNIRLVELSPFIPWTNQPLATLPAGYPSTTECLGGQAPLGQISASLILTQGTSFTLSSGAMWSSPNLTNVWYTGRTNGAYPAGLTTNSTTGAITATPGSFENGTPSAAIITNVFIGATNAVTNLAVANIQSGTNYISVWSDVAGSVTNYLTMVEVIAGPGDKTVSSGVTTNLTITPTGQNPPQFYQWKFFGTNLLNSSHYSGVTTPTLFITNVSPADTGIYSNLVTSARQPFFTNAPTAISVVAQGTLTVVSPPSAAVVAPAATNALWGSAVTFNLASVSGTSPFTYRWKRGGNNLSDGPNVNGSTTASLTLSNITTTIAGGANSYTVGVSNSAGGTISSAGVLNVLVPPPSIAGIVIPSTNAAVFLSFTTPNGFDTTGAFILQSAGDLSGPYTNDPSAVFSTSGGGNFSVMTSNLTGNVMFYRLLHAP